MTTYYQAAPQLAQTMREIQEKQDAIEHYIAKTVELGDLTKQTKSDIILKVKNNIDEIEKQYKNEESKGWVSSGRTRHYKIEEHVKPALDHLFNLSGLKENVNSFISKQVDKQWKIEHGDAKEYRSGSTWIGGVEHPYYLSPRDLKIMKYIDIDIQRFLVWTIGEATDIRDITMKVSFNMSDNLNLHGKVSDEQIPMIESVNFYFSSGKRIRVYSSDSSVSGGDVFTSEDEANNYIKKEGHEAFKVKLSDWEREFETLLDVKLRTLR